MLPNISTGCFYVTKYLNWLFCYLEGKFEIITRDLVIGGRRQGGSRPTRQRDFETGGQGDPLFENCVVAELKGDLNDFLYLGLKQNDYILDDPSFNEIFLMKNSLTWKTTITQKRLMPVMSPRMVRTPT